MRKDSIDSDSPRVGDGKMTNQFSFVERATQTMNSGKKVSYTQATIKTGKMNGVCRLSTT